MVFGYVGASSHIRTAGKQSEWVFVGELRRTVRRLEQTHPQNSRYTPRCPFFVLWTPCSRVGVCPEPTIRFGEAQAACEPGGGGCGGVPVHPDKLHTHRTSPAQALLTMLTGHAATSDLLSHCHRRVSGVRCALAER